MIEGSREKPLIADARLDRPGIKTPTSIRYATTADPEGWTTITGGRAALDTLAESIIDGRDRVLLAWPERPGNAFTLAALGMREARASGRLASATVGVWPWRPGLVRAARSLLVHPEDISSAARNAMNDQQSGEAWANDGLAHHELGMVELRLRDLVPKNAPHRVVRGRDRGDMVVRNPTLLETTVVFPPSRGGFASDPDQVLRRVRDHTFLGESGGGLQGARAAVGDPGTAPFAILGFPAERTPKRIIRYLQHQRIVSRALDVMVVDLTRQAKVDLGDQWEARLSILLEALDAVPGRRPGVLALCEDPFTLKAATRVLRTHNARLKPRRQMPEEIGLYLSERGLLAAVQSLPESLPAISFQADIKDASLVSLRDDLVSLVRRFREAGDAEGVRAVAKALSFLRRTASLPVGVLEARTTADILFDADDDVDSGVRAMFRHRMALAELAKVAESAADGGKAGQAIERIEHLVATWQDETPVSAKLAELMSRDSWNTPTTLIAVPERRTTEVLIASDRAVTWRCTIVEHRALSSVLENGAFDRVIVTGPTTLALRVLLVDERTPRDVILLGDASGAALLAGELAPLTRLAGFSPVAARASALQAALKRGGIDEKLNLEEAEFRFGPIAQSREIDLSREGETYTGDRVVLATAAHRIVYRPQSDVLVFTSNEARLFEKLPAREVERGDQILVLDEPTRDRIRDALATSRTSLSQLAAYHAQITEFRNAVPGSTYAEKAREVLRLMRELDPSLGDNEVHNVQRWLTADLATPSYDGARQPRAARDENRFNLFMTALGVEKVIATTYWNFAIVPTRSYRVQEGHQFNRRVVQFVLDPESTGVRSTDDSLKRLWLSLLEAVDEVESVEVTKGRGADE